MPRQQRSDAVEKRIAGCKHADLTAALLQHLGDGLLERTGPRPRGTTDQGRGELKMALAAEHNVGI